MALERRVVRLGRGEAVFHFLRGRNGRAAVGIKGNGILVDVPLRCQGDVACDRSIKVIRGGVLLVFAQIPEGKGMALERRLGRQDSLLAALDVLLIGHRETAVSVEGNGIFLRHMYTALRLDLPVLPAPDQRDRIDLLIVLDMFQGRERLVELGHIGVGDIVDVAKPVVPDFLRLADDVVFIVLAEQAVGLRMLLRTIYIALDQNSHFSHFKLFQLVSRRGFGRGHFMRGFDPRVRCRFHPRLTIFIIGEVERDGRRGLGVLYLPDQIAGLLHEPCRPDSHWADISARAIAYDLADRMLCVGRVSERILYHIMRSGCRNADNIYNNAGHVVFRGLGGLVGGGRVLFPHSIQRGGSGHNDAAAGLIVCGRCTAVGVPSEEGIAVAGRRLRGNGESMGLLILRGRLVGLAGRCADAAVGIIVQRESQQNGRAFEIVICGVLAVGKQGACALAASVAAASGPTDVVDLVIVNTIPDILCIGKTEGIVVDVVPAEVNGDVIAADA